MDSNTTDDARRLVADLTRGDSSAAERLIPVVYDELRNLAAAYMSRERADHTLQPTALVNEACMRLLGGKVDVESKAQFLAVASRTLRRVLVDHARKRRTDKRGGGWQRITLDEEAIAKGQPDVDVLILDEALGRLAAKFPRSAEVAEMRFFGSMTIAQVAAALDLSTKTINEDWNYARAFLSRTLSDDV